MRVAVIDSGVNPRHPHISSLAGGVSIGAEGSYLDTLGHGTAVMAAIQEKAPDAEYFAVKLFHTELRASTDGLLRALEWTIENGMDVVNLSLGTRNGRRIGDFEKAVARGVKIVAARDVDGEPCYPGCLPGVVGVGLDWEIERDQYRVKDGVYYASGYPRPVPGVPMRRNLNGISFAVANVTGLIASGRIARPTMWQCR
jgi:subtilisin family serine protease